MAKIQDLLPTTLWGTFEEITHVPRPSKHEEKIIEYLVEFGKKHGIETLRDEIGNVLMRVPATPGMEGRATVVLQSHVDMVCEKRPEVEKDFATEGIEAYIEEGWVRAKGTTLGGDDGIGMAAQLAAMIDPNVAHGPLECLFTVDEETGLTGAFALKPNFFTGKVLVNLDSEDEGELFIGCAGGVDTVARFTYKPTPVEGGCTAHEIRVGGLRGGHSGDDIHKGLASAVKVLARLLDALQEVCPEVRIAGIAAGNLRNAIARDGHATLLLPTSKEEELVSLFNATAAGIKGEFRSTEGGMELSLTPTEAPTEAMSAADSLRLVGTLVGLPHGVLEMSREMPGLVETSTNLASIKGVAAGELEITTSQRSSVESAKQMARRSVASVFRLGGCSVKHSDGYPGWAPNPSSPILDITVKAYEKLFETKPIVRAIHAGLECGLFLEKYPDLDMVSFGPTIRGAHSPDERLEIASVDKFWALLLEVLKNAPEA